MKGLLLFLTGFWNGLFPTRAIAPPHLPTLVLHPGSLLQRSKPLRLRYPLMLGLVLASSGFLFWKIETRSYELPASMPSEPAIKETSLITDLWTFEAGVTLRNWKAIVLHHSATTGGNAASFGRFHQVHKGWRSLGYHFVIANGVDAPDGKIEIGPRWKNQEAGAHARSTYYNEWAIGICLVGNFEEQHPTPKQIESLQRLIRELRMRLTIDEAQILGHREVREGGTVCPGKHFPMHTVRAPR